MGRHWRFALGALVLVETVWFPGYLGQKLHAASASPIYDQTQAFGADLTLNYPGGGETWIAGTAQTITWTTSGAPSSPISYFSVVYT